MPTNKQELMNAADATLLCIALMISLIRIADGPALMMK